MGTDVSLKLGLLLLLSGCASSSADIVPSYVSPLNCQSYDCEQLTMEA